MGGLGLFDSGGVNLIEHRGSAGEQLWFLNNESWSRCSCQHVLFIWRSKRPQLTLVQEGYGRQPMAMSRRKLSIDVKTQQFSLLLMRIFVNLRRYRTQLCLCKSQGLEESSHRRAAMRNIALWTLTYHDVLETSHTIQDVFVAPDI